MCKYLIFLDWGFNVFDVQAALQENDGYKVLRQLTKVLFSIKEICNCSAVGKR